MSPSGPMTCAKHPQETTYLRCNKCDRPICTKCAVQTPVGFKCRECGVMKLPSLSRLSLAQALFAGMTGLACGAVAGVLLLFVGGFGFFVFWLALPYGRFAGTLIQHAAGCKSGLLLEILAASAILLGGLGIRAVITCHQYLQELHSGSPSLMRLPDPVHLLLALVLSFPTLLLAVIAACAVSRLRWAWGQFGL